MTISAVRALVPLLAEVTLSFICPPCPDPEQYYCQLGSCTGVVTPIGDSISVNKGFEETWTVPEATCEQAFEYTWLIEYQAPETLQSGMTNLNYQASCTNVHSQAWQMEGTYLNAWYDLIPKALTVIGIATSIEICLETALSQQLKPVTGPSFPAQFQNEMLRAANEFTKGGSLSICIENFGCQDTQIGSDGKVKPTVFHLPQSVGHAITVKYSISNADGSWHSEGPAQTALIQPSNYQRTNISPLTLGQWASLTSVGEWCLLAVNADVFKSSYTTSGPVTVPPCLHTDNLTSMSTIIEGFPFIAASPSQWDWDKDLITRMGPLLMQVMRRQGACVGYILTDQYLDQFS